MALFHGDPLTLTRSKPTVTDELRVLIERRYGLDASSGVRDLGGSWSLNLFVQDHVVRVHGPWTTPERVSELQHIRRAVGEAGIPTAELRRTVDGVPWCVYRDLVVEAERYVDGHSSWMESPTQMDVAMRFLGRVHTVMQTLTCSVPPPIANHLPEAEAIESVQLAATVIRSWRPTAEEEHYVRAAEDLAHLLPLAGLCEQLVHGDFKDNNVLFRDDTPVCLLDFDFAGVRPRIDDVALPIHYELQTGYATLDDARRCLDAYDSGLDRHLTSSERRAFPSALARMALAHFAHLGIPGWSEGRSAMAFRNGIEELSTKRGPACVWWLQQMQHIGRWQAAFS